MTAINYGLIGFGGIAENRIAKEGFACDRKRFPPLKQARLVAATDLNPARSAAAEALGLRWFPTSDALLADPSIDAVFIATNNATHVPLALKAFAAGKHVISEKPIAANPEDALTAVLAAEKAHLSYSVDHMMVWNAWNREAAALLARNSLGTVNDCCFHMEFAFGYDPAEAATWRCSRVAEMGGPIGDVASHCFYVAESLFQKRITRIAAVYYPKIMKIASEDGAYIKFFFEDGMQGSVKAAFSELRGGAGGTMSNLGFEIYGDRAVLRSYGTMFQLSGFEDEPIRMRLELDRFDGSPETIRPTQIQNLYQGVVEAHADSIQSGHFLSGRDGLHNLLLCAAAHESARTNGRLITVTESQQSGQNRMEK